MILIVERDPFIRLDLAETVADFWEDVPVISVPDMPDFVQIDTPVAVLLDAKPEEISEFPQMSAMQDKGVQFILTNANGDEPPSGMSKVARPFTAETLKEKLAEVFNKA